MLFSVQRALLCGWMAVALEAALIAAVVLPQHGSIDLFPRSPLFGGWLKEAAGSGSASASSSAAKTFSNPALAWAKDRNRGFTVVLGAAVHPPDDDWRTEFRAKKDLQSFYMHRKDPTTGETHQFNKGTGNWDLLDPDLWKNVALDFVRPPKP
ncbi:hypothetical protein CBOM_03824 [Ceraceosorus bombacis]|uniref:Uncharacterized protein n=1 Tax=Ceraceosorus bombacis TaxID=401625 RepID=A0A0P1BHM3_9BASI|nr:hypothetical protein CBOM_03824 [Ceraceosorus bombacis]